MINEGGSTVCSAVGLLNKLNNLFATQRHEGGDQQCPNASRNYRWFTASAAKLCQVMSKAVVSGKVPDAGEGQQVVEVPKFFRCCAKEVHQQHDAASYPKLPQLLLVDASEDGFTVVEVSEVMRSGVAKRNATKGKGTKILAVGQIPCEQTALIRVRHLKACWNKGQLCFCGSPMAKAFSLQPTNVVCEFQYDSKVANKTDGSTMFFLTALTSKLLAEAIY